MPLRQILRLAPEPVRRRVVDVVRAHLLPRLAAETQLRMVRQAVPLPVRASGRRRARPDPTASPAGVRQDNLDRVVAALTEAGVDWFRVPNRCLTRTAVAVPQTDRVRVKELLDRLVRTGHGVLETVHRVGVLRASWPVTDPGGHLVLGTEYGCEVEFWRREDGVLVGPRSNPVADVIPADEPVAHAPEQVFSEFCARGDAEYRTRAVFTMASPERISFPIDAVYTWVDGDDPAWRERKARALGDNAWLAEINRQAANDSRFASRDELRYSLRALHCFAPWVRHIFLVTDDQVPAWLDTDHPNVTVVGHREIFGGTGVLPTFNSQAIESRLHRIPGLAEHFLYLNDDVFMARPQTPATYFTPGGLTRFFPSAALVDSAPPRPSDPPVNSAGKNNRRLIQEAFGRVLTRKMMHTPHPSRRSVITEIEDRFAEHVRATAEHQFRHPDDIALLSSLQQYYAYLTGRATPGQIQYMYTDLADPGTRLKLARVLRRRHLDAFCLNDTDSSPAATDEQARLLAEFLPAFLPFASPYELSHPRPGTTPIAAPHIPATRGAPATLPAQGERPDARASFEGELR
ncbi:stealth family protein [Mangrovihabitans endophyticus]|uniref:Exopolysaccharide phosphotransferase n=1 Tax=Mangrovihabitans endophyticus TaxID=1751298 RepID=A0A8J3FN48_9ACTN|nr:stealth family protein [Mangrovihabitans endophyticus]GGK89681.1 exopolysaccharide phosphotransferase [Mangrovihabitans endophyticus]